MPAPRRVEEDQRDVAGLVLDQHPVGRLGAAGRGGPVRRDGDRERHRLADRRLGDRALQLAGDAAARAGGTAGRAPAPAGPARRRAGRAAARSSGRRPGSVVAGREERVEEGRTQGHRADRARTSARLAARRAGYIAAEQASAATATRARRPIAGAAAMSGSTRTSADLDVRRRRILFRAWHRGMREMDLIMGRFADAEIGTLSDEPSSTSSSA